MFMIFRASLTQNIQHGSTTNHKSLLITTGRSVIVPSSLPLLTFPLDAVVEQVIAEALTAKTDMSEREKAKEVKSACTCERMIEALTANTDMPDTNREKEKEVKSLWFGRDFVDETVRGDHGGQ